MRALLTEGASSLLQPLQDVCENATVALFVMDERQHCVYMNRAAELLTGFVLAEVQGRPLHDFVHHHRPDGSPYPIEECPIDRAAPQNNQERGEEVFIHKAGHSYPVAFTASPVRRGGKVVGTVIEVQDISARKRQEAEREALRKIGLLILQELDVETIVQAVTDAATQLTGAQFGAFFYRRADPEGASYPLYTLSGAPWEAFSKFPVPRETGVLAPSFRGEATVRVDDIRLDERYGKTAPYHGMPPGHLPVRSYLAVPVRLGNGEAVGALLLGHEAPGVFTEEHARLVEALADQAAMGVHKAQLFEATQQARERAEREAREKDRLYRDAAEENRKKEEFLATLAHELRNPLAPVRTGMQILRLAPAGSPAAAQTLGVMERQVSHMVHLIDDLLDVSRISRGLVELKQERVVLRCALDSAIEASRPLIEAGRHQFTLHVPLEPLYLDADPVRLAQVVNNLLNNAAKYTPEGGCVDLSVQRDGDHVLIQVSDTGIGIAPETLPRVFEMFAQVEGSVGRSQGGLGIGLSISRKLVEMHQGTLEADSPGPGCGATFTVRLPLAKDPSSCQSSAGEQDRAAPETAACKVLVVDDNVDAAETLVMMLGLFGHDARAAHSGPEALQMAAAFRPAIVFCDIGMPGMDGHEVARRLRSDAAFAQTRLVALTGWSSEEDRRQALEAGFDAHLAKPVEVEAVQQQVMTLACAATPARLGGDLSENDS